MFGVKLIGVNSQVGTKSIFTVVVLVSLACFASSFGCSPSTCLRAAAGAAPASGPGNQRIF